jgi:hypothetical protein
MAWNLACPDWEQRLRDGRSIIPELPLWQDQADAALAVFRSMNLADVIGTPTIGELGDDWFCEVVRAVFGSVDPAGGRRIRQFFPLVPKKNNKTTGSALLMLTALLINRRRRAKFILAGPTQDAAELAFPDITRFERALGVRAGSLELGIGPDGASVATIALMCLSEVPPAGASAAGTPIVTPFTRFSAVQGSISRGGAALGGVTGGTIRMNGGLSPTPTVGAGTGIGGIDLGEVVGGGALTVRFANHALETEARAQTPAAVTYTLAIDANTSVEFHYPRAFLRPTSQIVDGPGGITRSYDFIAADDGADQSLLRVTLKNQVATY